jgi:hypothetical protein
MELLRPVGSARSPLGSIETMIVNETATATRNGKGRRSATVNETGTSHVKRREILTARGSGTRNEEIEVKTMNEEAEALDTTIGTRSTIMNAATLKSMVDLIVNGIRNLTVKRIATATSLQSITGMVTRKKRRKTGKKNYLVLTVCQVSRKSGMMHLKRKRMEETEVMRTGERKGSRRTGLRMNVQKRYTHLDDLFLWWSLISFIFNSDRDMTVKRHHLIA